MTKPLTHLDKRILTRSIRKGLISDEEYQSSLNGLPDSADNIAPPEPEEGSVEVAEGDAVEPPAASGSGWPPVDPSTGGA